MTSSVLEAFGKYAGIGGLALGVFLLVFRDLIRRLLLPQLTRQQAFHVIKLILWLVFSIAALGIIAWIVSVYITTPRTPSQSHVPALPAYTAAVDARGSLLVSNSGGPAFNVARDSNSRLTYYIPQQLLPGHPDTLTGNVQRQPNLNGVGSLGGDTSYFRINYDTLGIATQVHCEYLKEKAVDLRLSSTWLTFELNVLHTYDDSIGNSHKRSWRLILNIGCPPKQPYDGNLYQASAAEFQGRDKECAVLFPNTPEQIRQVVLAVLDNRAKCV